MALLARSIHIAAWSQALKFLVHRHVLGTRELEVHLPERDLRMRVHARDVIGRHIYKYHVHDPELTAFIEAAVRPVPGDVLFDVGANVGWFSLILQRLSPVGVRVFAFEPHPDNHRLLEANLLRNGDGAATPVRAAVSDVDATLDLFVHPGENSGRHTLLPVADAARVSTPAVRLDAFCERHEIQNRPVRFVKIDIEGYELVALRGAGGVLSRCPLVVLEHSPRLMTEAGIAPGALLSFMEDAGFTPSVLASGRRQPTDRATLLGDDRQCNVVWDRASAPP